MYYTFCSCKNICSVFTILIFNYFKLYQIIEFTFYRSDKFSTVSYFTKTILTNLVRIGY